MLIMLIRELDKKWIKKERRISEEHLETWHKMNILIHFWIIWVLNQSQIETTHLGKDAYRAHKLGRKIETKKIIEL